MAVIQPTSFNTGLTGVRAYQWVLANGDQGAPVLTAKFADKSVQMLGTLGVGGSMTMRGSNLAAPVASTASDWQPLTDPQGNAVTKTALFMEQLLENPLHISPAVTAGDGTTSLTVILIVKG
jgi:hypothetical protein